MKSDPSIAATGILNSYFQFSISSSIQDMKLDTINKAKKFLKNEGFELLKKHNIKLKNNKLNYEIIPIKYNPQNINIINLTIKGEVE